ncbi:hypothetical protein PAMP_015581 [Pampus punctatissimus]
MAAAATKCLYFTFTLLCLLYLASALTDKDQLEKYKDDMLKLQEKTDRLKAWYESELDTYLRLINDQMNILKQMTALLKKVSTDSDDDFLPFEGLYENLMGFMENTKAYVENKKEDFSAQIEELEKKIRKQKKLIEFLEENQAEL